MVELVRVNNVKHCYIRPLVFRGAGEMGVNPLKNPIEAYILAWAWGKYLGDEALRNGVDVCISLLLAAVCAQHSAGYGQSFGQLHERPTYQDGSDHQRLHGARIRLDHSGHVSEASGENIFVIRDSKIYTPPLSASALPGITRDSVMMLALEMGYAVSEQNIAREMLYIADEVFFAGTAAEITPIRSIDRIVVGKGQPGTATRALQERFLAIVQGQAEDKYGWLTLCNQPVAAGR